MSDIWKLQAEVLIKKAVSDTHKSPEIYSICSMMDRFPRAIPSYLNVLLDFLRKPNSHTRLICLHILDAVFNGDHIPQLTAFQAPQLISALSAPDIADDPELHNFLSIRAPRWTANCATHRCLTDPFTRFVEEISATRFVPKLNDALRARLTSDLLLASEATSLLSRLLLSAITTKRASPLIAEVLPHVREIKIRTFELAARLANGWLRTAAAMQDELCAVCVEIAVALKRGIHAEPNRLLDAVAKAEAALKPEPPTPQTARAIPRRRNGDDGMPTDEFFARFDEIKRKNAPANAVDSLLEL
jgi:hypothetical protein